VPVARRVTKSLATIRANLFFQLRARRLTPQAVLMPPIRNTARVIAIVPLLATFAFFSFKYLPAVFTLIAGSLVHMNSSCASSIAQEGLYS
jgi:hypothetical protein